MNTPELGTVRPGDILAGKYRVERVLGVGGMGVVVAAHHLQLDQKVALKFLLPQALASAEVVARFDREARAAARIKSEHVARVIDVGKLQNGAPYMVMEYLEGGDLAAWLEHRGPLPVDQAVEFVLQACEAIAEAHALGIIHRDLKPANLFCIRRPDGLLCIKVLDFGISKMSGMGASGDMGMTRTAAIVGSPFYMSPEQMHSAKGVDPRTDLWSLGVILYELLTDRVPFEAEGMPELVIKVLRESPTPLMTVRPGVPARLEAVILRCLEKDRNLRFAGVGELVMALVEFAPPRARLSLEVVSGIAQAAALQRSAFSVQAPASERIALEPRRAATAASWAGTGANPSPPPRARASRWVAVAVLGGVLALGPIAAWYPFHGTTAGSGDAAPEAGEGPTAGQRDAALAADVPSEGPADAGIDAGAVADTGVAPRDASVPWWRRDGGGGTGGVPTTTTSTTASSPLPADCLIPYFYDAHGNKVFKIGCLP